MAHMMCHTENIRSLQWLIHYDSYFEKCGKYTVLQMTHTLWLMMEGAQNITGSLKWLIYYESYYENCEKYTVLEVTHKLWLTWCATLKIYGPWSDSFIMIHIIKNEQIIGL